MKQNLVDALSGLRGFIDSVIKFGGSFGSPADAHAKVQVLEGELSMDEDVKADVEVEEVKYVMDTSRGPVVELSIKCDALTEDNAELVEEVAKLKLEKKALVSENQEILLRIEQPDPEELVKEPAVFEPEELPKLVWCSKCFGMGELKDKSTCPVCKGSGKKPFKG